ncbi:MAG TPA: DMT family transporter [Streptosporangiaceae bacterium]|nr:DMT family transporter [Streptosporangiaceae bacterium]
MSPTAIVLVLAAAIAHASWNLFSKQAATTGAAFFLWLVAAGAAIAYVPAVAGDVLISQPRLTGLSWIFLVGTGVLQSAYFLFLQTGYGLGDLSVVYPIGRGSGAMLAALGGIALLGERPGPVSIAGIVAIIGGAVLVGTPGAASQRRPGPKVVVFALVTGVFIASYTIWDKYAVGTLHTPPILQGYAAFPVMAVVLTPVVVRDRERVRKVWREFRPQAIGAAVLAPLSYILVLAALSFTAVSVVAPAREVSVLFGVLLGGRLLGEGGLARRLTGAAAIVAGIIAIAIG